MKDKKLAGVWLDTEKAIVVKNHDGQEVSEFTVCGHFKHEKQHGNSNENAAHNSEVTTKTKFFKEIDKAIENTVELYITGPGTVQEELKTYLHETAQFKDLKITLDASQQLGDEGVLNAVKKHFGA